jgi:hypothetical protein
LRFWLENMARSTIAEWGTDGGPTGLMRIWRMRPDGSGQEQITHDGFNNWFPHISPDGKWIVYIAFPPDIPRATIRSTSA